LCVRCRQQRNDVDRAHVFWCDACSLVHQRDAFGGDPPLYVAAPGTGRCEFCDQLVQVSYRQWLLCRICQLVLGAYRRGRVSAAYALARLREVVEPVLPDVVFNEADPVLIQAATRGGRRRTLATRLDLEALRRADGMRAFWVEVKTGPGAADEMGRFQLDCSDCDDIVNVVRTSGLPAFVVHCQVRKVPEPPTMRLTGHALWWTDLDTFRDSFIEIENRRDERKRAAYFDPACFRPIESFGEFLSSGGLDEAIERLAADGCPGLYPQDGDS
jgi:hypothetical protein